MLNSAPWLLLEGRGKQICTQGRRGVCPILVVMDHSDCWTIAVLRNCSSEPPHHQKAEQGAKGHVSEMVLRVGKLRMNETSVDGL